MGKLETYIVVMTGLLLVFYFAGILDSTINSTLLDLLLDPANLQNSDLKTQIFLVLEGIAVAGIIIGAISRADPEMMLMGTFAIYLFNLLWDFLYVFGKVYEANPVFAILLMSPLLFLYGVTVLSYWRRMN